MRLLHRLAISVFVVAMHFAAIPRAAAQDLYDTSELRTFALTFHDANWLSLLRSPMRRRERVVVAFFGIRGIGSFYYLAYAVSAADFPDQRLLWATLGFVVIVSVVVHGVSATPVMQWVDAIRDDAERHAADRDDRHRDRERDRG